MEKHQKTVIKSALAVFLSLAISMVSFNLAAASAPTDAKQAENAFFRGSHLLSRDNMSEALPALEEAVQLDPQNEKFRRVLAVAYNNYAIRLSKEGKTIEGLRLLEKANSVVPNDEQIQKNFVNACLQSLTVSDEHVPVSEKLYFVRKALEFDPAEPTLKKAMAALINNEGVTRNPGKISSEEIKRLEEALTLDPSNPKISKNLCVAMYNLALEHEKNGQLEDGADLLRKAAKLCPKDHAVAQALAGTLSNLAVVKGNGGDFESQISLLKEALELKPGDSTIRNNLAGAHNNYAVESNSLDFASRLSNFESSLKLDAKNPLTHSNLSNILAKEGVVEYKAGKISKAIELLEKSLKHDPKNKAAQSNLAAIYHNQAISYGEQGKHEQEIQRLNKALAVAPDNQQIKTDLALAYNDYAVSLEKKGDAKQQISLLNKAIKLAPDNKVIKENLARAKEKENSGKTKDEAKKGAKK